MLRPDGEYAYAAVPGLSLLDPDTPTQGSRRDSQTGDAGSQIGSVQLAAIGQAVRRFGGKAWNDNALLKSRGEKRIFVKFPDDPTMNWNDWKKRPDVYAT